MFENLNQILSFNLFKIGQLILLTEIQIQKIGNNFLLYHHFEDLFSKIQNFFSVKKLNIIHKYNFLNVRVFHEAENVGSIFNRL